ncbi:MAG: hypothetical protein KBG48_18760 [Kofleriaceae bacterium]|nr:hypothetical protein [Kofleriaceae bacterium]MBP9169449.1 hypothetical protein [Kofleriaceae bacterium]MBP9861857.1 hypothetical protein [Kofleriaceae bacterium]
MNRWVLLALLAAAACSKSNKSGAAGGAPPVETGPATAGAGAARGGPGEGAVAGGPAAEKVIAPGTDSEFAVEATPAAGAAGAELVARVVVRPGKGFHMNKDYPTKLTLEVPAGVTTAKPVLLPADAEAFDDNQLAFAVKLTPAAAGDYSVPATLKFAVCTESTCNPKKTAVALALKAQ